MEEFELLAVLRVKNRELPRFDESCPLGPHQILFRLVAVATLLPSLLPGYREVTGRELGWRPLVVAEKLCFTRDRLPNVGSVTGHPNILYVQALGGHGLAVGTLLGTAAAEKLWRMWSGEEANGAMLFDAFASVPHGWLPPWQPWRRLASGLGVCFARTQYRRNASHDKS